MEALKFIFFDYWSGSALLLCSIGGKTPCCAAEGPEQVVKIVVNGRSD